MPNPRDFTKAKMEEIKNILENDPTNAGDSSLTEAVKAAVVEESTKQYDEYKEAVAESFAPQTQVMDRTEGLKGQIEANSKPFMPSTFASKDKARPATQFDLGKLDESNIMELPFIQAMSFDVPRLMDIKLKDPAFRPRWVNYKSLEGANYSVFLAQGFENAKPEDCVEDTLMKSFVKEDGTIKYLDVVLMKIPTLTLMGRYKANVIRNLERMGNWDKTAIAKAEEEFKKQCSLEMLSNLKQKGYDVTFYNPTGEK